MPPDRQADRPALIALIEQLRDDMNTRLDQIAQAAANSGGSPTPTRRAAARPAYRGAIVPTDLERAKAIAVLRRMGLLP